MNKGIEELVKLLMELREFYDSMLNPFIPVISLHAKELENQDKTKFESFEETPLRKETEKPSISQENAPNFEILKKNLMKDIEEVGKSLLFKSSDPTHVYSTYLYPYRCLSLLLGNKAREILNALNESRVIENRIYKSLIGKLELMQNIKKAPKLLGLVLSTYLLTSNFNERSTMIIYSLLQKRMQNGGLDNE